VVDTGGVSDVPADHVAAAADVADAAGNTGCGSHATCAAQDKTKPYCQASDHVCVACLIDLHCAATTNNCEKGACVVVSCKPGATRCKNDFVQTCNAAGDGWDTDVCPQSAPVCAAGVCKKCVANKVYCKPPETGSAVSTAVLQCSADGGSATVKSVCTGKQVCLADKCGVCVPGAKRCDGAKAQVCAADGASWQTTNDCGSKGIDCLAGLCVDPCAADIKSLTHVGCDYWAVDLDNAKEGQWDAQNMQFAVVISNTSKQEASVTVRLLSATPIAESKFKVAAGAVRTIKLPDELGETNKLSNQDGSGINSRVYHIKANQPIIAYQFNPLDNVGVFSNDASLLLPRSALGTDYYVMSGRQITNYLRSYFAVVATSPGTTTVQIEVAAKTMPGQGVSALKMGGKKSFSLTQGQVLNIESDASEADLTGSHISSDKPVGVFGGSEASRSPNTGNCVAWQKDSKKVCAGSSKGAAQYCTTDKQCQWSCCADHLEEQLFPVSIWGATYVGAHLKRRGKEKDTWRVLASVDATTVTIKPNIGVTIPTLKKGGWFEFDTDKDFVLEASAPVQVAQYMASSYATVQWERPSCQADADCKAKYGFDGVCTAVGPGKKVCEPLGDPSLLMNIATSQYLKTTIFLVPDKYKFNYTTIVAPVGTKVTLDKGALANSAFTAIPSTNYMVARLPIGTGAHTVDATNPVGVWVYGYDKAVSYGYAAGAKL
jgi:hypothetical protein